MYKRVKEERTILKEPELSRAIERLKNMTNAASLRKPFYEKDLVDLIGLTQSTNQDPGEIGRLCEEYAKHGTIAPGVAISRTTRNNGRFYDDPVLARVCFELYTKEGMPHAEIAEKVFGNQGERSKVGALIKHFKMTHPDEIDRTRLHISRNFGKDRRAIRSAIFETAESLYRQGEPLSKIADTIKTSDFPGFAKFCPSLNAIEAHLIEKGLIDPYENGVIENTQIVEASFAAGNPGQFAKVTPGETTRVKKGSTAELLDAYGAPSYSDAPAVRNAARAEILKSQNIAQAFLRANPSALKVFKDTGDYKRAVESAKSPHPTPLNIVCGKDRKAMVRSAMERSAEEEPEMSP